MTWQPKSSLTVETSHWTSINTDSVPLHSSSRLWDLDFQIIFLLSPGKMLLTMFLFQKWLGSPFPEDVWAWWLLMHWLQFQFTPCEALPSVWIGFAWQYSQTCGHPCCLCTFSYPTSSQLCTKYALIQHSLNSLSVMALCDLPSSWRVSMIVFWTTAKSAVFSLLCFQRTRDIRNLYCMVIYWNSNVNILIFWDTDFWISLAVKSNHQN